jgi:ribosomal protein L22
MAKFNFSIINYVEYVKALKQVLRFIKAKKLDKAIELLEDIIEKMGDKKPCLMPGIQIGKR